MSGDHGPDQTRGGGHGHGHGHGHALSADADRRYLLGALALILGYMAVEVVAGVVANSIALISDAAHMLTDASAIALALIAMRIAARPAKGAYTFGYKRAEILSAQINGVTLLLLVAYFVYEGVRRLLEPPEVHGPIVVVTAVAGIAVNALAAWLLSRANRRSLNVEGAFQHVLNDMYAFIATAVAGLVVWLTGFRQADTIAALVVAALMLKAGWGLLRDSGRVLLQAAPSDLDPDEIGRVLAADADVEEIHDLHVWTVTSGYPTLSAHVIVARGSDCHRVRTRLADLLHERFAIGHTTLQVDHGIPGLDRHCEDPHGPRHSDPLRSPYGDP
ncbi:cation diffusion facilitator family transporter [Nonomuraea fuscirosea]|jgi:cobalt-zinc-cadmium efflux system protein|uniref:cation diffusion facilitator family transporter n=1 Tax=Nonomuraea fuscirosea TaxID=1291556 RepID=UPI002DD8867F|nr:cation diffusion facilitator family transporter [Nonomuraea fuscirosea]WSA55369.1 cation diffusion facilitator family transporter [Nonomuraea fuscirosea]